MQTRLDMESQAEAAFVKLGFLSHVPHRDRYLREMDKCGVNDESNDCRQVRTGNELRKATCSRP